MTKVTGRRVGAAGRSGLLLGVSVAALSLGAPAARAQTAPAIAAADRVVSGSGHTVVIATDTGATVTTTNVNKAGGVAFNRFESFEVAKQKLVTLVLPDSTSSLVNVVARPSASTAP
jgi:hypothetical protein